MELDEDENFRTSARDPQSWWDEKGYERVKAWAHGTPIPAKREPRPYDVVVYSDNKIKEGLPPKSEACVVRCCSISDTHSLHDNLAEVMPAGDLLLHTGDFTNVGKPDDIEKFAKWFVGLPFRYKVVIAGNHDKGFEKNPQEARKILQDNGFLVRTADTGAEGFPKLNPGECVYLEDAGVTVEGLKIFGSPWQPWFFDWAFNLHRGAQIRSVWKKLPLDTDILLTHGPVWGFVDKTSSEEHAGCADLLEKILEMQPVVHISGHIHEARGVARESPYHVAKVTAKASTDNSFLKTVFINACVCTLRYEPTNPPITFDIDRKAPAQ